MLPQTARSRRASAAGGDAGLEPGPEGTIHYGDKGSCPPGAQQGAGSGPDALTVDTRGDEGPRAVGRKRGIDTCLAPSPRAPCTHLVWTGAAGWAGNRGTQTSCSAQTPPPPPPAPRRHPRGHLCRRQHRFSPSWVDSLPEGSARVSPAVRAKLATPLSGGVKVVVEAIVVQGAQEWAAGVALPPEALTPDP